MLTLNSFGHFRQLTKSVLLKKKKTYYFENFVKQKAYFRVRLVEISQLIPILFIISHF